MPKLDDFREMINGIDDLTLLESGQVLLREMMEVNAIRQRLASLEDGLTEGGKAIFYFFASELNEDELVFAAERISGRVTRINRAKDIEESKKEKENTNISDENEE
jgi:hypothetical protein